MFGCAAAGVLMAILGALGVWAGLAAMFSTLRPLDIGWLLPLSGVYVSLDPLGGFFIALLGAVAIPVGVYSIGYGRHLGGANLSMLPLFVAAMLVVPAAGSVTTFLLGWELMAAASLVLVLAEHRRPEVRSAGLLYAAMTQLGFVAILVGLMVMSASAGTDRLAGLSSTPQHVRGVVFVLTVVGFGSKAGLLPLHAWLPRAHPEAPSPVSALMSAAMVTLGIYGIVRFDLQVLGPGPRWWGLVLLAVGGASAVYGVLQSAVATDLKRLLAYSTTENMGLIALALGAAVLLADAGASAAATIAMTAAMLHLVAHAAFKSLGFLGAGSVLVATGLRDLDRLGGLVRRMPTTTLLFGLAALGASGLPLGAGFVSEWLLIQSLVHASDHNTLVALAAPVAVGAVALTTGLGVAAMVKAFGIGFLARPRSAPAESAVEVPPSMLIGMWIAAIGCLALGVVPAVVAPVLRRVLEGLPAVSPVEFTDFGSVIRLPGVQGSVAPGLIGVGLIVAIGVAIAMTGLRYRSRPPAIAPPLWACGADDLSSRMQYTATSFAEPLERVFDDVLRPDTDIEVTHHSESQYMVEAVRYRARITDGIETHLYAPLIRAVLTAADLVRRAHTGSVHRYLAFGALGVLLMLVAAR
ncbi:MAG TPA: proton-conducting transporter membrane subunit [Mycobacterium sp.]|nr:proton-conducting transporter membrane subunit [Mycobacterium sp.]